MHFSSVQQIVAFAMAIFSNFASSSLIVAPEDQILNARQADNPYPFALEWWQKDNFAGPLRRAEEPATRRGKGDCQYLSWEQDRIRSVKAPQGWKCTLYDEKGCHGFRTREFNHDGIAFVDGTMFLAASAWRCCQIGQYNYWGYCDSYLYPGS